MPSLAAVMNVLKGDVVSVANSGIALMRAYDDFQNHPDSQHQALLTAAFVTFDAAAATAILDGLQCANNPILQKFAAISGFLNLVSCAAAAKDEWNTYRNPDGTWSDPKKEADFYLNLLTAGASGTQVLAELAIIVGLAPEEGAVAVVAGVAAGASNVLGVGQVVNLFLPYGGNPNTGNDAVIGANSTNTTGDISDGQIVIVHADAVTLRNGNVSMGAYSSDANTLSDYILDKNRTITNGVEIHFNGDVPQHETMLDFSQQNLVRTYNLDGNIVRVTQAYADGSGLSMTINGHPVTLSATGTGSFTEVNYIVGTGGTSDSIVLSAPGASTGTRYVLTNGIPSSPTTVTVIPTASRFGSSVGFHANVAEAAGEVGAIIGSSLGNFLAHGNQVEGVVYGSLLGVLGQDLAGVLTHGMDASAALPTATSNAFSSYLGTVGTQIVSAGAGLIGDTLFMELGQDLGLGNFGSQLLGTVGSSIAGKIASNITGGVGALQGFNSGNIFAYSTAQDPHVSAGAGTLVANAIGSFMGATLGALVVSPQTQAAGVLSSLGSSIGSWALTTSSLTIGTGATATTLGATVMADLGIGNSWIALNLIAPGVGAFVGFVLGALIGNLFGHKKSKIPTAGASTVLSLPSAQYKLGSVTSSNGGATDIVVQMATSAARILNGIIAEVTGNGFTSHYVSNSVSPTQTYGYTGSQLYVTYGGVQHNTTSAEQAVDLGVLWALPQTQVIGGDIFVKRAIKNANATDVTALAGDIQTAKDYENYLSNKSVINSAIATAYNTLSLTEQNFYAVNKALIDKIDMSGLSSLSSSELTTYNANKLTINDIVVAVQSQSVANPWIITLESVNELGLNVWSTSDFYGGMQGFLQSFGMGQVDSIVHYEDVTLSLSGGNLTIGDGAASGKGLFSVLAQASTDGSSVTINSFASVMGYATSTVGATTSTSTIEFAGGTATAVTISNSGHAGYNIFIGGNGGNNITAGTNDTWIQGGAGTDVLHGGAGHDVIIAGSGNTTIYGGSGDSYLASGAGSDTIFGGGGVNTIVAGSGSANLNGGSNGNTTFIAYQNGAFVWFNGAGSNNTASFERWSSGVNIDLSVPYGFSWNPTAVVYANAGLYDIQNLIGSVAGGNTLKTGGSGGTLEGGAGNDSFIGVTGGATTVSFANSGAGVYVDLSVGVSFGGSSVGDVFTNIKNVTGSAFNDELRGVAGSTLNGGTGGDDWFDYSGGGNTFTGNTNGNNVLDYSLASVALTVNLGTGVAQVSGKSQDHFTNVSRIVGSAFGTVIAGTPNVTTTTSQGVTTTTISTAGIYFIAGGGVNTLNTGGADTVDLELGGGKVTVNHAYGETLMLGAGSSYDNLWISALTTIDTRWEPDGGAASYGYITNLTLGLRGGSDSVTYNGTDLDLTDMTNIWNSDYASTGGLTYLNMNGASTLDLSDVKHIIGGSVIQTFAENYPSYVPPVPGPFVLPSVSYGIDSGGNLIVVGGGASTINVDGHMVSQDQDGNIIDSYGQFVASIASVVVAGKAAVGGLVINTSHADDQFAFERGDGHYTINGTGGQKTIAFGPTVGADDVIYKVVGNDLYVGIQDLSNLGLTADQVSDNIRIVNGALGSVVSGTFMPNNPYFVLAGGTTVDLSKIAIAYKLSLTTSQTFTASNAAISVANSLTETVTGSGNTITGGTSDTINLFGAGSSNIVNMSNGTVKLLTAGSAVTVAGNNDTITVTGSGSTVTVHGTGGVINASNTTIYKGNTSTATITGTGNTVVTLGVAPIILDLSGAGLELTAIASSNVVTTASNGALTRLGWVGPTNGILVTDRNGDGQYGDVEDISFTQDRIGAETDLEGLAGWDSNGDGVISATDTGWSKLTVWVDANMDGISTDAEVKSLNDLGITSINLQRTLTDDDTILTSDSYASATSTFTRADGTTGKSYDVTLGQAVLSGDGWTGQYGITADQLSGGQLGHLTGNVENPTSSDISYTASDGMAANLIVIRQNILGYQSNLSGTHDASLGSGAAVAVTDPNRGAHVTTQRLQVLDLDLSGWGPSVTELGESSVKVDVNLTGNPYGVAWVGASDGLLVIDAVGDGDIDVATEATFQSWVPYARTSLQGLTAFDTSGDGAIDADDKVFGALRIWSDRNGDGVSQAGEMTTLSDLGVKSISLKAGDQNADTKALGESQILASATVTMTDGSTHLLYDVALGVGDPNAKPDTTTNTTATDGNPTLQGLTPASDVTVAPVTATSLDQSLTSPLDATTDQVSAARSSQGPVGEVMTADGNSGSTAGGWWQSNGYSLSDAINQFNAVGPDSEGQGATPVAAADDAAMIQRHLLLRQAIAGFTVQGAAPAVFARQGGLDTLNTLAAATQSTTTPTSGMTSKAA